MGVTGTGKTTMGTLLAQHTGWPFFDGDDFHPAANKAKMAAGHPLTDEDRAPWLAILHDKMVQLSAAGTSAIVACSALKSSYRDTLRAGFTPGQVQFAVLLASPATIDARLHLRQHQFMNPALLASQLATLQMPNEHDAWPISVEGTREQSIADMMSRLRAAGAL